MKWKELYRTALPTLLIIGCGAVTVIITQRPSGDYIVDQKKDNKIWYHPILNPKDTHVMTFSADTTGNGLYDDLKIGDTITGKANKFDAPVVNSTEFLTCPPMERYVINSVNRKIVRKVPLHMPVDTLKQKQR